MWDFTMNLEEYFKTNDLDFRDCLTKKDAEKLKLVIEKLESNCNSDSYRISKKDKGLSTDNFQVFLKD